MKKLLVVLLACAMLCGVFVGCGGESDGKSSGKSEQVQYGEDAYVYLVGASQVCDTVSKAIYGAWYFTIYDGYEEYSENPAEGIQAFASACGLKYSVVDSTADKYMKEVLNITMDDDLMKLICIAQDASSSVDFVIYVYQTEGILPKLEETLDKAKESMQKISEEYKEDTDYETLRALYSEVSAYYDFCESPSGSFNQLASTLDGYRSSIQKHIKDLEFIYD